MLANLTSEQLDALRAIDSPTIANAIELLHGSAARLWVLRRECPLPHA
jgi:hypothetical protein